MKGETVLVTGGGGFIGVHLVQRLLMLGANVRVIHRASDVPWRLEDKMKQIQIYRVDICDAEKVYRCIQDIRPNFIFHLAAYGVNSQDCNEDKAIQTNVRGIANIIHAAADTGCKRIINIGTCAEYGNYSEAVTEDLCLKPVNIYGSSKAAGALIAHQMANVKNIDIITLRLFGVFGEYEERHKIFCHTILTLLEEKDLQLTSCTQYRDYCYVGDIINAILLAANCLEIKNEIFNVGRGKLYPLRHYIEIIHRLMKSKKKLLFGALDHRQTELWAPKPDITKIQNILGWSPQSDLENSIKKTIRWYKNNYHYYLNT